MPSLDILDLVNIIMVLKTYLCLVLFSQLCYNSTIVFMLLSVVVLVKVQQFTAVDTLSYSTKVNNSFLVQCIQLQCNSSHSLSPILQFFLVFFISDLTKTFSPFLYCMATQWKNIIIFLKFRCFENYNMIMTRVHIIILALLT